MSAAHANPELGVPVESLRGVEEEEDTKDVPPSPTAPSKHAVGQSEHAGISSTDVAGAPVLGYAPERDSANPLKKGSDYPPLEWSSFPAFRQSLDRRLRAMFSKRFLLCILWGQVSLTAATLRTTRDRNHLTFVCLGPESLHHSHQHCHHQAFFKPLGFANHPVLLCLFLLNGFLSSLHHLLLRLQGLGKNDLHRWVEV